MLVTGGAGFVGANPSIADRCEETAGRELAEDAVERRGARE